VKTLSCILGTEDFSICVIRMSLVSLKRHKTRRILLMPPSAASFFYNSVSFRQMWRKRVGVEPTILAAKDRINGFEGHENHRIPFASATIIGMAMCAFNFSQECSALSCALVREV
jgi:hypothetical protein